MSVARALTVQVVPNLMHPHSLEKSGTAEVVEGKSFLS